MIQIFYKKTILLTQAISSGSTANSLVDD